MNKHIKLVEKWLNDKDSVTQEELEQNKKDAYYADDAAYYAADAAAYAAFAADAAADDADDADDVAFWVEKYHKLTGEEK